MLKVYDKNHTALCHINKYKDDIRVEEELDGGDKTLSFSYIGDHDIQNEYYIETKDDEFVVKEVNRDTKTGYVTIVCALNLEGLETQQWSELNLYSMTVADCARHVLSGTNWTLGYCDVTRVRNIGMVEVSSKTALQDMAYAFICDVHFDSKNRVVSFYEKMGNDRGVYFLSGLNLRKLQKTSKSYDFYTRIIPIGADGLTIAGINGGRDYLENHQYSSKNITYLWKDDNYDNAEALKEDAEKKLNDLSKPEVSYSADVIDLARENTKYSIMEYGLGDTVTIIDRGTFTKDVQRIKKLTRYLRNPNKNTCEISNVSLTFDEILSRLRASEIRVNHTINSDGTISVSDILNWEGELYESEMYDEVDARLEVLSEQLTGLEDLIGDANVITAKDITVEDIASTDDGIYKKRVTIGSGEDAISYDYIDNGDFVLLGAPYGAGTMGGSGYFTQISSAGLLRANNAIIYGTIYATDGQFFGDVTATTFTARDSINMSYGNGDGTYVTKEIMYFGIRGGKENLLIKNSGYIGINSEIVDIGATDYLDLHGNELYISGGGLDYESDGRLRTRVKSTAVSYVEARNSFHSIELRTGTTGNVGIRIDENMGDMYEPYWLIYKRGSDGEIFIGDKALSSLGSGSGTTPKISAKATVSNTTGTPSVSVTKSGTDAAPSFTFAFSNLKGAKGDQGPSWNGGTVSYASTFNSTLTVDGQVTFNNLKTRTSTGTANVRVGETNGQLARSTASSRRYKNIISELTKEDVEKLYDVPTFWFTYKTDYLDDIDDERYDTPIPGFIAEELNNVMPIAVDHKNGLSEMWNSNIVVPLMFEMIKGNHSDIKSSWDIITELRLEVAELKKQIEKMAS